MATSAVDLSLYASYEEMVAATGKAAAESTPALKQFSEGLSGLTDAFAGIAKGFAKQMQELGSSLQRLVTAGLASTNEGNRLSYTWMLFSRQIASIFLPTINYVIVKLQQMTEWFKKLTGDQQRLIESIGSLALGFVMLGPVIGIVMAVLSPLTMLIAGLGGVLYVFFTQSALGKAIMATVVEAVSQMGGILEWVADVFAVVSDVVAVAIDSVLAVFVGLGVAIMDFVASILEYVPFLGDAAAKMREWTDAGQAQLDLLVKSANREIGKRDKTEGPGSSRTDVNPSGFGFESLSASFERITSAANKQDLAKDALTVSKKQLIVLEAIQAGVQGATPGQAYGGGKDF